MDKAAFFLRHTRIVQDDDTDTWRIWLGHRVLVSCNKFAKPQTENYDHIIFESSEEAKAHLSMMILEHS